MNQDIAGSSSNNLEKTLNSEQFDRVIEAILAGKYSWACVLMLRFTGYNPLHYIPYRTYNRLLKDNTPGKKSKNQQQNNNVKVAQENSANNNQRNVTPSCLSQIKDLPYLEVVGKQKTPINGAKLEHWLGKKINEYQSKKSEVKSATANNTNPSLKLCNLN